MQTSLFETEQPVKAHSPALRQACVSGCFIHPMSKVTRSEFIIRMRKYLIAKSKVSDAKKEKAERFCRDWLRWVKYYQLSHKERYAMFCEFRQDSR